MWIGFQYKYPLRSRFRKTWRVFFLFFTGWLNTEKVEDMIILSFILFAFLYIMKIVGKMDIKNDTGKWVIINNGGIYEVTV